MRVLHQWVPMDELGELRRERSSLGQHLAQVALRKEAGLAACIAVQDALRRSFVDAKRLQDNKTPQITHQQRDGSKESSAVLGKAYSTTNGSLSTP